MLKEFREFIMRGNVVDLAVGIIIGVAFGAIVTSLVNDIIMPVVGLIVGGIDFSQIVITLKEGQAATTTQAEIPAVTINIGVFINTIINFLIVSFAMFLVVRAVNRLSKMRQAQAEEGEAPPEPTVDEKTLAVLEKLDAKLDKIVS